MAHTDPIADMLTRVKNAIMAEKKDVAIPLSTIKLDIAKILKEEGYIRNYKTFVDETRKKFLKVYISYDENSKSVITGLQRVSKPGRRVYVGTGEISKLKHRLSMVILSTSKGLMTDRNASKNKVGGEPLLMVW